MAWYVWRVWNEGLEMWDWLERIRPEACSFTRDDAVPDEVTMPGLTRCRCLTRSEDRWPDAFYAGAVEGKCV